MENDTDRIKQLRCRNQGPPQENVRKLERPSSSEQATYSWEKGGLNLQSGDRNMFCKNDIGAGIAIESAIDGDSFSSCGSNFLSEHIFVRDHSMKDLMRRKSVESTGLHPV